MVTIVLGGLGVLGLLWSGYSARLELLPSTAAGLVLLLLTTRVLVHEVTGRVAGTTEDVAATLTAAGLVGVLGAHLVLIRGVPRFGFRALFAFGLMVVATDVVAFFVGRWRGRHRLAPRVSPMKSWEGAIAGICASVVVGIVIGSVWQPPFDISSGAALGVAMGFAAVVGDLVFSAIKRSAGAKGSGGYLGAAGGALDAVDSVLFAAPAFYWALRTLAL